MIEKMIVNIKRYLPLKIYEVQWDGTTLLIHGQGWNFTSLSAWRISTDNEIYLGCFDKDSIQLVNLLRDLEIIDITYQDKVLKVDPIFILSNNKKIEIFSTDTYEPWTFQMDELGIYIATPSDPSAFD